MTFVNIWSTPCRVKATFGIIIANHVDKKVPFLDTKKRRPAGLRFLPYVDAVTAFDVGGVVGVKHRPHSRRIAKFIVGGVGQSRTQVGIFSYGDVAQDAQAHMACGSAAVTQELHLGMLGITCVHRFFGVIASHAKITKI